MAISEHVGLPRFVERVNKRNPGQPEFAQAVSQVAEDIFDFIGDKVKYHEAQILRCIAGPDGVISFRVYAGFRKVADARLAHLQCGLWRTAGGQGK